MWEKRERGFHLIPTACFQKGSHPSLLKGECPFRCASTLDRVKNITDREMGERFSKIFLEGEGGSDTNPNFQILGENEYDGGPRRR